jgi:hypothetical protein
MLSDFQKVESAGRPLNPKRPGPIHQNRQGKTTWKCGVIVNLFTISVLQTEKTSRACNPQRAVAVFDDAVQPLGRRAAAVRVIGHPVVFPQQQSVDSRRQPNAARRGRKHSDDVRIVYLSIGNFVRRFKAQPVKSKDSPLASSAKGIRLAPAVWSRQR